MGTEPVGPCEESTYKEMFVCLLGAVKVEMAACEKHAAPQWTKWTGWTMWTWSRDFLATFELMDKWHSGRVCESRRASIGVVRSASAALRKIVVTGENVIPFLKGRKS